MLALPFLRLCSIDDEKRRHAPRQTIGDLFENCRSGDVGDIPIDFNSAIDWAGVHVHDIWPRPGHPLAVDAQETGVFTEAGGDGLTLTFVVDVEEFEAREPSLVVRITEPVAVGVDVGAVGPGLGGEAWLVRTCQGPALRWHVAVQVVGVAGDQELGTGR